MSEITAAGYAALRAAIGGWWIELRDDQGEPVMQRLDASDDRVTVTDDAGTSTVAIEVELTGGDVGAEPGDPVSVVGSVLFADSTGGSPLTEVEQFDPAVLSGAEDVVIVRHEVQAPEQA